MPYNGPGPRNANELPKRKRKKDRKKQECIPMMMALLACYKENNYGRLCPSCCYPSSCFCPSS